jgi:PAS domain-containing protein
MVTGGVVSLPEHVEAVRPGLVTAEPKVLVPLHPMNLNDNTPYQTILNAIPTPVFVVDDDVRIADLNEVASGFSGQEKGDVLSRLLKNRFLMK